MEEMNTIEIFLYNYGNKWIKIMIIRLQLMNL